MHAGAALQRPAAAHAAYSNWLRTVAVVAKASHKAHGAGAGGQPGGGHGLVGALATHCHVGCGRSRGETSFGIWCEAAPAPLQQQQLPASQQQLAPTGGAGRHDGFVLSRQPVHMHNQVEVKRTHYQYGGWGSGSGRGGARSAEEAGRGSGRQGVVGGGGGGGGSGGPPNVRRAVPAIMKLPDGSPQVGHAEQDGAKRPHERGAPPVRHPAGCRSVARTMTM